jgi:hypothetical protein
MAPGEGEAAAGKRNSPFLLVVASAWYHKHYTEPPSGTSGENFVTFSQGLFAWIRARMD